MIKQYKCGVIGLGYVGLPLALAFAKKFTVVGYDNNSKRINELQVGIDSNNEFTKKEIQQSNQVEFSNSRELLSSCDIFIITVPTPISKNKKPD